MLSRLQARRIKLGADGNIFDAFPSKQKRMRKRTCQKQRMRAIIEESRYWGVVSEVFDRRIPNLALVTG